MCEKTNDEIEYPQLINKGGIEKDLNSKYLHDSYIFTQYCAPTHTSFFNNLKKELTFLKFGHKHSGFKSD